MDINEGSNENLDLKLSRIAGIYIRGIRTYAISTEIACSVLFHIYSPDRRQSKTLILSTNVDKNSKKQFSIAFVANPATNGNRKYHFLQFCDLRSSIV